TCDWGNVTYSKHKENFEFVSVSVIEPPPPPRVFFVNLYISKRQRVYARSLPFTTREDAFEHAKVMVAQGEALFATIRVTEGPSKILAAYADLMENQSNAIS